MSKKNRKTPSTVEILPVPSGSAVIKYHVKRGGQLVGFVWKTSEGFKAKPVNAAVTYSRIPSLLSALRHILPR